MIHTTKEWQKMLDAMHSGNTFECDQEVFYYWLEVLPPVYMNKKKIIDGKERVCFGFAEGIEKITDFWQEETRYFGKRSEVIHNGM